jgi:Zn-finger nucleic acid-binding protein
MQCPSCNSHLLKPIKLQPGLAARQCQKCKGILLDLLAYRDWAENHYHPEDQPANEVELVEDTSKALICPKCSKIMLKFRISGDTSNRVDVCQYCDEAWLDHGEWELLGALKIQDRLNAIFTDPWQRNIREETTQKAQEQRFRERLGDSEYTKLKSFEEWISDHPNRDDIIRYIMKNH